MSAPLADLFRTARPVTLGRLTLTLPAAANLGGGEMKGLALVAAAEADGLGPLAERFLADLEKRLGVTSDHRMIAGTSAETVEFTEEEIEKAVEAHEVLRRQESRRLWKAADASLSTIESARKRRQDRAERVRIALAMAETVELAQARGEEVATDTVAGRPRAKLLNVFDRLYERGDLDGEAVNATALKRAGEAYREAYEIAAGERGPDRTAMTGGGGFGSRTLTTVVEAGAKLKEMRAGMTDLQRKACDLIAGEDRTVQATAEKLGMKPGRSYERIKKALREGLVIVGENRGWW